MGVSRRIRPLTLDAIAHLPDTAACDHWRRDLLTRGPRSAPVDVSSPVPTTSSTVQSTDGGTRRSGPDPSSPRGHRADHLAGWAADVIAEWGHCGMVAEHEGATIGYLALAPARLMPQIGPYANSPVGSDAAVVLAVHVVEGWTRRGIGRQLVQAVAADLTRREVAALEAVGSLVDAPYTMPEGWLDAVGFRLVRDHPLTPRYRLDLSSTLRWRPRLSAAWHRVRGLVDQPVPPEPAGFADGPRGRLNRHFVQQRRRTELIAPVPRSQDLAAPDRDRGLDPSPGLR